MFVQLVIAAINTAPSLISTSSPSSLATADPLALRPFVYDGKCSRKLVSAALRAIRSWGRFGPAICAVLDEHTRIDWNGGHWHARTGTKRLCDDGRLEEIDAP